MPPPRTREILKFSFFKMQILRILREIYPNNWSSNVQLHAILLLSVTDEILIISNSSVATGQVRRLNVAVAICRYRLSEDIALLMYAIMILKCLDGFRWA